VANAVELTLPVTVTWIWLICESLLNGGWQVLGHKLIKTLSWIYPAPSKYLVIIIKKIE
jgi:hypothetical protein